MSPTPRTRPILRVSLPALLAALLPAAASAQETELRPHFGVGYVINGPHQFLGFSAQALSLRLGGIGAYVDMKFDRSSPSREVEFDATLTAAQAEDRFGDRLFQEESSWRSFNVALLRPVIPELILYAGVGSSSQTHYRTYYDESASRGLEGLYTVEDPRESGNRMNLLGGGFFRIGPTLMLQFGVEMKPRGFTVGGVYTFTR
jgi:hypothetical protein